MIKTFRDADTKELFDSGASRKFRSVERVGLRKLIYLNQARSLQDLAKVPGNQLHALTKERSRIGQHAIRINDQLRVCFTWKDNEAFDVEITDCH